jgi:dihydroorotate dehydrogenase
MIYPLLRELLFRLDAEDAHELTVAQIVRLQNIPLVLRFLRGRRSPVAGRRLFGLSFTSPVGIAAGFDKNALMMPFLAALGFGFIEVGTVTLHPQPGNPRPRMFRLRDQRALVNRLGFNNDGADAVAGRLRSWQRTVPLFVNIGKNRDVPLDGAPDAYAECHRRLAPYADVCVLNLSSPNTPSLRELQRPEHLMAILRAVDRSKPLLVKIAPDVDDGLLREICDVAVKNVDGLICTNTTATPDGGLSGRPLMEKSTAVLRRVRELAGARFPLIGVGGIFTADDARAKFAAGADLVQLYTSFVYEGPALPRRLANELGGDRRPATGDPNK